MTGALYTVSVSPRFKLPSVTLVTVTGLNPDAALFALWASSREIEFGEVKIVSPHRFPTPEGVVIESPRDSQLDSINSYNHYMIYELWRHVHSEHALVVQGDGYIINPGVWTDEFLEYDYIGAPWRKTKAAYIDPFGNHQRVGNGGFSLRSQKLLTLPRETHIPFDTHLGDFYKHMDTGLQSEDGNICVHNRHIYEKFGCRFAGTKLASKFSREKWVPERGFSSTFGFHKNLPIRAKPRINRLRREYLSG